MQKISQLIISKKNYLLLILVAIVAYWPISLNVFALKNDALIYFLPYRYQISESIQNGMFPWWSPYLYTGIPLHSDMQSGVWNPVVMLISVFTTYNMSVLQWEMIFYLATGGIGVYKLVKELNCKSSAALVCGIAYMCCGFMTDSGSIVPWITSAAYLPFAFLYFLRLLNRLSLATAIKFSLALALLLTAGYPSFFIYCLYIMLAGFIGRLITSARQKQSPKSLLLYSLLSLIVFIIVSAPVLLSWWDFFGYYDRGAGTDLDRALSNSFPSFSSISYLLPSAVSKPHEWLKTDLSARNASVGIFIFLFFILSFFQKFSNLQKFILAIIAFSFLFSLGKATPLREWCYDFLPLMNAFRHPASMRVFTSLGILLLAAPVLSEMLSNPGFSFKRVHRLAIIFILALAAILFYYLPKTSLLRIDMAEINKSLLDRLTFADFAVIQSVIQLCFIAAFLLLLKKKSRRLLTLLIVSNCIIFCWMALPFTFISQVRTSAINRTVEAVPRGFPSPDLQRPLRTDFVSPDTVFDYRFLLTKTISLQDHLITPTITNNYIEFLHDTALRQALKQCPVIYFSDSSNTCSAAGNASIQLLGFSGNGFSLTLSPETGGMLNVFQQYHHGWNATVDGKAARVFKTNKAFMGIVLAAGKHDVVFRFQPSRLIQISRYVSLFTLLLLWIVLIRQTLKNNRPFI